MTIVSGRSTKHNECLVTCRFPQIMHMVNNGGPQIRYPYLPVNMHIGGAGGARERGPGAQLE